jgi:hypothetical protein
LNFFDNAVSAVYIVSRSQKIFGTDKESSAKSALTASARMSCFNKNDYGTLCCLEEGGAVSFEGWLDTRGSLD